MRARLKPSILGQWLCAGDLGSGRGRGARAGRLPSKSNVESALSHPCLHPSGERLPAPMGAVLAVTVGCPEGCVIESQKHFGWKGPRDH